MVHWVVAYATIAVVVAVEEDLPIVYSSSIVLYYLIIIIICPQFIIVVYIKIIRETWCYSYGGSIVLRAFKIVDFFILIFKIGGVVILSRIALPFNFIK